MNAFIFPGQGSQSIGMGRELYEEYPKAKDVLDKAVEILGYDLKSLMFNGPEEMLTNTLYAQPAIYTCSAMYLEKAKNQGIEYGFVAGHSLGEYSALYAAGIVSFEDGLKLVKKRAMFMSERNDKGTMAAVLGMSEEELNPIIASVNKDSFVPRVVMANLNARTQIVISGENDAVDNVEKALSDRIHSEDVKFRRLSVSAAFHSPQMSEAAEAMREEIEIVKMNDSDIKFVSNVTGKIAISTEEIRRNLMEQMTGQVRWYDTVLAMKDEGVEAFYEIGNGNVLRKMNKAITMRPKCFGI